MHLRRPPMVRTMLVPVLVLLLGLGAIASIASLQVQSHDSAAAQLKLARVQNALSALQVVPFRASPALGGSPASGRVQLDDGKRQIDRSIRALNRDSPPAELLRMPAGLRTNYATLERIYRASVTGFDDDTTALAAQALSQARRLDDQILVANRAYERRSQTADSRASVGSAAVILLLVAGFGLLYRRSVKARTIAEGLVVENGRLLAASRVEALIDSLTALPNRRSLRRDLDAAFDPGEPDRVLALFDLDGFKQYNDTFGHPAGDALLTRLGVRLAAAVRGRGTAYRMGGDEFCVLAPVDDDGAGALVQLAAEALSEAGEAFDIGCSYGRALIGSEAATSPSWRRPSAAAPACRSSTSSGSASRPSCTTSARSRSPTRSSTSRAR